MKRELNWRESLQQERKLVRALYFMLLSLIMLLLIITMPFSASLQPTGGNVSAGAPETAPSDAAGSAYAQAGNVTALNIFGYSTTQSWQGYFGNITGVIQLGDAQDKIMYNWTLANPEGEIYASTNATISWSNIQCFNFTATGEYTDESGNGGTTNLYGLNLTGLETMFNISSDDVDGVNETFTLLGGATHDLFYTGSKEFNEGECRSTRVYGDSGAGVNNEFEEVLLYEPSTASVIFSSLIDEESVLGFNNADNDFEMLVLENGHGTDVSTTTYYFFVEIE